MAPFSKGDACVTGAAEEGSTKVAWPRSWYASDRRFERQSKPMTISYEDESINEFDCVRE
jgi:hypothetical protein